jgi:predicted RecB family nuclease
MKTKGNLRICKEGHKYFKSTDCPTCPVCEQQRKPEADFLMLLSGPARRAAENAGIKTLKQLSKWSETELLKLHGMGPASIPTLRKVLNAEGLSWRKE